MAKEDMSLPVEMGKLKIEPTKINRITKEENPFEISHQKKSFFTRTFVQNAKCSCTTEKDIKSVSIVKKKPSKILKEPVVKILKSCVMNCGKRYECQEHPQANKTTLGHKSVDVLNLCALVDNCNQLKISSETKEEDPLEYNNENKWWKSDTSNVKNSNLRKPIVDQTQSSCSQQALNPPCDVTIDELASYFETLVHIPKKMSSMAEMMYI